MDDIYKSIEEYKPIKKGKILIVFTDMISDMLSNKKPNPVVTELSIRGIKSNISLVFITQSYFAVLKNIRLNWARYFVTKIPNKRKLQQITFNHSQDIDFQDIMIFVQQNHILFWLLILLFCLFIVYVLERIL